MEENEQSLLTQTILHHFIQRSFLAPQYLDSEDTDKSFLEKVLVLEKISITIKNSPLFKEIVSKYFFGTEESSVILVIKEVVEDLPSNWGRIVTLLTLFVELKKQAFFTENKEVTEADIRRMTKIMRHEVFDNFVESNVGSWEEFMVLFGEKKSVYVKLFTDCVKLSFLSLTLLILLYVLNKNET